MIRDCSWLNGRHVVGFQTFVELPFGSIVPKKCQWYREKKSFGVPTSSKSATTKKEVNFHDSCQTKSFVPRFQKVPDFKNGFYLKFLAL